MTKHENAKQTFKNSLKNSNGYKKDFWAYFENAFNPYDLTDDNVETLTKFFIMLEELEKTQNNIEMALNFINNYVPCKDLHETKEIQKALKTYSEGLALFEAMEVILSDNYNDSNSSDLLDKYSILMIMNQI